MKNQLKLKDPSLSPASVSWRNWTGFWTWRWPARVGWHSSPAKRAAARQPWFKNSPGAPKMSMLIWS
jgi:hypothetical protein